MSLSHLCWRALVTAEASLENLCIEKNISFKSVQEIRTFVPQHMEHITGSDPVFVTTCVLGVVTKHSNAAWDQVFRNNAELIDLLDSTEDARNSPLAKVSLFPLISILAPVEEEKLASRYFWTCSTKWKRVVRADTVDGVQFESEFQFSATCRDKHGSTRECAFWINAVIQNHGALLSRIIRCRQLVSRGETALWKIPKGLQATNAPIAC